MGILTLAGLAVVLTLGLSVRGLALAATVYGGAGLWTGLLVFRRTYERNVQHRPPDPARTFRWAALTLFLTLFWLAGVVQGLVGQAWAEAFATFVLWWCGVMAASVIDTWRQYRIESR